MNRYIKKEAAVTSTLVGLSLDVTGLDVSSQRAVYTGTTLSFLLQRRLEWKQRWRDLLRIDFKRWDIKRASKWSISPLCAHGPLISGQDNSPGPMHSLSLWSETVPYAET
jgi:hypothetical protein